MKQPSFADRLKAILAEHDNMTAYALAKKANLPKQTVYRFMTGKQPSWDSLLAMAEALQISLDEFRPIPFRPKKMVK